MIPYKIHLDAWTVALYSTDTGLTITVSNSVEPEHYLTRVVADVQLRRYHIGQQCAGELHPSPWPTLQNGTPTKYIELDDEGNDPVLTVRSTSKEALMAAEGAG